MYKALILIGLAFSFSFSEPAEESGAFFCGISGNLALPAKMSKETYVKDFGFGARLGIRTKVLRGLHGSSVYWCFDMDRMEVDQYKEKANIYSSYLGYEGWIFFLKFGTGFGALYFDLPSSIYRDFGNSTLTELLHKNKKLKYSNYMLFGVALPLQRFFKPSFIDRWTLDYEFRIVSAEYAWMFWHDLVSTLIAAASFEICDQIAEVLEEKNMKWTPLIIRATSVGILAGYWAVDYEYHNWPWNDPPPYRMYKHSICVSFEFGRE